MPSPQGGADLEEIYEALAAGEEEMLTAFGLVKANAYMPQNFAAGLPQTYRDEGMGKPFGPWTGDEKDTTLGGEQIRFAEHHIYIVLIVGERNTNNFGALSKAKVKWSRLYDEEFISKMWTLHGKVKHARVDAYMGLPDDVKVGNVSYTGVLYDVRVQLQRQVSTAP